MEKKQTGRKKQQIKRKRKRGKKMFESELKMKIGGISDEGGKKSRMLDKSVNPEEKKLLERNEIREEMKTE